VTQVTLNHGRRRGARRRGAVHRRHRITRPAVADVTSVIDSQSDGLKFATFASSRKIGRRTIRCAKATAIDAAQAPDVASRGALAAHGDNEASAGCCEALCRRDRVERRCRGCPSLGSCCLGRSRCRRSAPGPASPAVVTILEGNATLFRGTSKLRRLRMRAGAATDLIETGKEKLRSARVRRRHSARSRAPNPAAARSPE